MSKSKPTISLCMIAKNEESFIAQCIESVQPIIQEIILVDTGSTDRTVEIAESFGARVFHRPWDDDFSAPRNLSIEKASGDWILVLDADEVIAKQDLEKLQELTKVKHAAYEFLQRHYGNDQRISQFHPCKGEYPEWEREYGGYFTSNLCRLFPNGFGFRYQNRVHELVEGSIRQNQDFKILRTDIPIHHYGHTPEVKLKKKKNSLYSPLGSKKIDEDPQNWKNHYELAVEHNCNGNLEEAIISFRTAAALCPQYVQTWINLGYVLNELSALGSAHQALTRALAIEPNNPEAHLNIAVTFMRQKNMVFAESHLKRAIAEKPDYTNAWCNLGQVYLSTNRDKEAEECYRKVIELFPENVTALCDLGAVLAKQGKNEQAISKLEQALKIDSKFTRAHYFLGCAYNQQKEVQKALKTFENFYTLAKNENMNTKVLSEVEMIINNLRSQPAG